MKGSQTFFDQLYYFYYYEYYFFFLSLRIRSYLRLQIFQNTKSKLRDLLRRKARDGQVQIVFVFFVGTCVSSVTNRKNNWIRNQPWNYLKFFSLVCSSISVCFHCSLEKKSCQFFTKHSYLKFYFKPRNSIIIALGTTTHITFGCTFFSEQ